MKLNHCCRSVRTHLLLCSELPYIYLHSYKKSPLKKTNKNTHHHLDYNKETDSLRHYTDLWVGQSCVSAAMKAECFLLQYLKECTQCTLHCPPKFPSCGGSKLIIVNKTIGKRRNKVPVLPVFFLCHSKYSDYSGSYWIHSNTQEYR